VVQKLNDPNISEKDEKNNVIKWLDFSADKPKYEK